MNFEDLQSLLLYIEKNNSWKHLWSNSAEKNRRCVKYVDFTVDTRDSKVWRIAFRDITQCDDKKVEFRVEFRTDLQKVYDWLNEPADKNKPATVVE